MIKKIRKYTLSIITLLCVLVLCACAGASEDHSQIRSSKAIEMMNEEIPKPGDKTAVKPTSAPDEESKAVPETQQIQEDGSYYDLVNVVLYLDTYKKLPPNYITKKQAESLGWEGGTVEKFQEGAAIGGSKYSNYEKTLPTGTEYHECDLDTHPHKPRGAHRLVYSTDGHYYYTSDHYEHFQEVVVVDGNVEFK